MTFTFELPPALDGDYDARGFWLMDTLVAEWAALLKLPARLESKHVRAFLSPPFGEERARRHLLGCAPEMDGGVSAQKGRLRAVLPEGLPVPTVDQFLEHHPVLVVAVQPRETAP